MRRPARDAARTGSTSVRASDRTDEKHLHEFVQARRGVEGFVESYGVPPVPALPAKELERAPLLLVGDRPGHGRRREEADDEELDDAVDVEVRLRHPGHRLPRAAAPWRPARRGKPGCV